MEGERAGLKELVMEELSRLGVEEKKASGGGRLLGIPNASMSSKAVGRSKAKGKRSPRVNGAKKSPKMRQGKIKEERKQTPKSPFRKRNNLRRQQNNKENKNKVFGRRLEETPSVCVYMTDGTQVTVPEFLVDVCNLIRRNVTVEGIFRKAGSSQRQSDLKKLIDSGNGLPSTVHVVDCACLLKQFLRSLPDPILSSSVHAKIIKCMDLQEEAKMEAIVLCTLLLPQTHRSTLVYLMDFFSEVVASSGSNLMDAHNLAIVLAPNLLPTTVMASSRKAQCQVLLSEDAVLATNIEILQLLIENASLVCRTPSGVAMALEHREKSQSTENLLAPAQPQPATRKKRRSASIHRLMTGLRRVVGHSRADSDSPLQTAESIEELDTLHLHPGVALSPMPGTVTSPRKRKSADAFDLGFESTRDPACETQPVLTPPSNKRAKVDTAGSSAASNCLPLLASTTPSHTKKQSTKMGQPRSIREIQNPRDLLAQPLGRPALLGDPLKRSVSTEVGASPKSAARYAVHPGVGRRSLGRVESLGPTRRDLARSQVVPSPAVRPLAKRRSCDDSVGARRANSFEGPLRGRRSSAGWRTSHNEPDGAAVSTLGPRGVPDGAECTLRDQLVPKPRVSNSIETLEQHYDDIKSVVRTMEDEFDKSNVLSMRETYFPDNSDASAQNMSYSEMIQSAYERMRAETRDLGVSPSDSLSKRLGKELKIRNRRSEEHRVIRSPSERKIGTIRRRSRELVQNASRSAPAEGTPAGRPAQTPKMKGALLQTPINASLRRGKPNSVKSGLPVVVRAFSSSSSGSGSPLRLDESPSLNSSRRVVVSKRGDESGRPSRVDGEANAVARACRKERSAERSSGNDFDLSSDDGMMGSFLEQLPGPTTRRRSSLLSPMSLTSLESQLTRGKRSAPQTNRPSGMAAAEPEMEEQQWVPASDFIDCVKDPEVSTGEENVGRPSLAALMKQKKVTANVQLFNNLHESTPRRRQNQGSPCQTPPEHSAASERRRSRLGYSKSLSLQTDMTPRELLKTRQKSFLFDRAAHSVGRMAVVSPLKESTWINIQREHSHETPKAYKGEATIPKSPLRKDETGLKITDTPVSSVFPRGGRVPGNPFAPTASKVNPPKLPPRASARPSPIRIQYR